VSEVEGFRPTPYYDNIGVAIGFGWNMSMQSAQTNRSLATGIGLPNPMIESIVAISNQPEGKTRPQATVSPDQGLEAVQLMRNQFEEPMKKLVPGYDKLAQHQKDTLTYHAYKVGPGGAAKYKVMLSKLQTYIQSPTEQNKLEVAKTFTYKYKLNGKVMEDKRSSLYLAALFDSPQSYQYLLGTTTAPKSFQAVAKAVEVKVDSNKPAEGQVQNELENYREQLLEKGIIPTSTLIEPVEEKKRNRPVSTIGISLTR